MGSRVLIFKMADQQHEEEPELPELYEKRGTTLQVWSFFGLKSRKTKITRTLFVGYVES